MHSFKFRDTCTSRMVVKIMDRNAYTGSARDIFVDTLNYCLTIPLFGDLFQRRCVIPESVISGVAV